MKAACRLTVIVGGLMLLQAALGLVFRAAYRDPEWIATTWLGNDAFFPLYVAAVIGSALALVLALSGISPAAIARRFDAATPVRLVGGYFSALGLGLATLWIGMWAAYVFAGRPTPIDTEAFKLVAAIAGVQGSLHLLVLSINSVIFVMRGLAQPPGEMFLWGTLAAVTAAATLLLLAHAGRQLEV